MEENQDNSRELWSSCREANFSELSAQPVNDVTENANTNRYFTAALRNSRSYEL